MGFNEISTKYQVGQIVELKVVKILTEVQLIVFELDGVSARLHIRNLSNNPDLSQKLFNIIREGETIKSEIIDFNQEKKYIELSLRPFRNDLEGSLSFTKCKNVIEARKKMRINQHKDMLEENRNSLDRIQGDLAKVDLTFLYELIQNAIDHPNPKFNNIVSIKFEVYNDYLLLKHDGNIFTENNFRSLTGILLGEEDTGEARIGYKGIGFKSIFRYTQEVYIRSGNFSFGFSKQRTGSKMPWEVIPIFENEIEKVEEIKNFEFFNTPVAFAFKFTNPELKEQAIQYLEQLVALPETLLFLDKLTRLEVVVGDRINRITREVIKYNSYNKINLQLNEELPQEWLVCQETNTITDEMILKELKDENNPSIPLKFRNFNTPQVQIAFPIVPGKELINMYAYLPLSETKCGLPYILNGDFIPNLDRTDIIKNLKYNNSLANLASKALTKLFRIVSKEYGIEQALSLISKSDDTRIEFFKHLTESFVKIKDELCIVTNSQQEVALKNFVIDKSSLFSILKSNQIQLLDTFKDCFVFGQLNSNTEQFLIDKIGLRVFTIQNAIELLSKPEISTKLFSTFTDVVKFLFQISRLKNKTEWISKIKALKAIKKDETAYAINELYKGIPAGYEELFKNTLNINSLTIEASALIEKRPRIAEMLKKFGLKEFNLSEALRQLHVLSDKLKTEANTTTIGQVWHFLYVNRNAKNADGSLLVNVRFKIFPIKTVDDKVEKLENCFAGDVEDVDDNFSFLHKNFGEKNLVKVNLIEISKISGATNKEIVDFLKSIHPGVKLTDKELFKKALKIIINLSDEEIENQKTLLKEALISVFYFIKKYPTEDLFNIGMYGFPVVNSINSITKIALTYLNSGYAHLFGKEELYAEKLFEGIKDIDFLSKDYISEMEAAEQKLFIEFLLKYKVSPGLKIFSKLDLKKKTDTYLDVSSFDKVYIDYNSGFPQFNSDDNFNLIVDIKKIEGRYSNLVLFWNKISEYKYISLLCGEIICKRSSFYKHPNPFIWIISKTGKFCPMLDNSVKSFTEVYAPQLNKLLLNNCDKIDTSLTNKLKPILDKIQFQPKLSNSDIINCLEKLQGFLIEDTERLILDHFSKANFSAKEIEILKSNGYLLAQDKTILKMSDLIYLDKSLESTSILLEQTSYPENKIMFTFEYNPSFIKTVNQLQLTVRGVDHIELITFEPLEDLEMDLRKTLIIHFATKQKLNNADLGKLQQSEFKLCSKITLGLKDIIDFHSQVESFYQKEENVFYYTELRELTESLCELYKWPISENKKLRKLLENDFNNGKKEGKQGKVDSDDKFIDEVNEFIKELEEGTEWSQHIIELKELLLLANGPGEQKKKVYNLLAKLKLAKNRNIQFEQVDQNDRQFNYLEGNGEKYIVHSARGSFAYISPIELLKMRDEGYKMALDFGNKAPVKIYDKAEDILRLNMNHLLLYQKDKTIEELFAFCESNQSANKRLLIIDKDHASNKSKEILKLMIPDEDY